MILGLNSAPNIAQILLWFYFFGLGQVGLCGQD